MDDHHLTTLTADRSQRLERLRRLSAAMAVLCTIIACLLIGLMVLYWARTPQNELLASLGIAGTIAPADELWLRVLGGAIALVPLVALTLGLTAARNCFLALARGEVFSHPAVRGLRGFAFWLLVSTVLQPIAGSALSVLLSLGSGGRGQLSFGLGSETLIALLFAGTVLVIATVMSEAIDIADDNAQIV